MTVTTAQQNGINDQIAMIIAEAGQALPAMIERALAEVTTKRASTGVVLMAGPFSPSANLATITPASVRNGFTLAELYAATSCDIIEVVHLRCEPITVGTTTIARGQWLLVVDEEGRNRAEPTLNMAASYLAGQWIVGDVALIPAKTLK